MMRQITFCGKPGAPQRWGSELAQLLSVRQLGEMWIWIRMVIRGEGGEPRESHENFFPPAVVWKSDTVVFPALGSGEVGVSWPNCPIRA